MKTLFWLYKSKTNSVGAAPLWVRITLDGEREQFATGLLVRPEKWNAKRQVVKGRDLEASSINEQLKQLQASLRESYTLLLNKEEKVSARDIKNLYLNKEDAGKKLLEVFREHNNRIKILIGKDYSEETFLLYHRTCEQVSDFIWKKYKKRDIYLKDVNRSFADAYVLYLKTERDNQTNTVYKNFSRLRKIINLAYDNDWIQKNPFRGYSIKKEKKELVYLTEEELERIETKEITIPRLALIRDLFLMQCYSGLAYRELRELKHTDITTDSEGVFWITCIRQKTQRPFKVPLLPKALELVEKYKKSDNVYAFPVISNVKLNAYLKELADICEINKVLTSHIGRKTFCTTVTLLNGVPLETVSSMVGHSSVQITQESYAQVLDDKISRDMKELLKKK